MLSAAPYEIQLAPWAEAEAGELSKRFGDSVNLTVGRCPGRAETPGAIAWDVSAETWPT